MAKGYLAEHVLRALPSPLRNAVVEAAAPVRLRRALVNPAPRWITLFVTNYCNARCEHCFYWRELNSRTPEMDVGAIGRMLESLEAPLNTLRLSGGEPFLRKDLEEIVLHADATRSVRKVSIPTHGMQPDTIERVEALIPRLGHTHLNVSVSLDGMAERHDANRKIRGGFDRAIAHLRAMLRMAETHKRFHPSVSISLTRAISVAPSGRRPELLDLLDLLTRDLGLRDIGFDHIRSAETDVVGLAPEWCSGFAPPPPAAEAPEVRNRRHDDVQLSAQERQAVNELIRPYAHGRDGLLTMIRLDIQQEIFEQRQRAVHCLAGTVDCVVYPSGDVAVCEFSKPFANLAAYDHDLPELLRNKAADDARRATRTCACTHPCHLSDSLAYDAKFLKRFLETP